jgi:hypothetical protein
LSIIVDLLSISNTIGKNDEPLGLSNTPEIIYQNIEQSLKIYTIMLTLAITINDEVAHEDSDTINKKLFECNETMLHLNG